MVSSHVAPQVPSPSASPSPSPSASPSAEAAAESERARRVAVAIHSGEMEGLHVDAGTQADAGEYVAGHIDSDELVARARARYGLD